MSDFVNLNNARPGTKYEETINKIKQDGVCPFCPEQLENYHKNPILKETKFWKVTDNMYPYKPTKHHILLIHKDHIKHESELSKEAWLELKDLMDEVCKERNITGGALMMRFGDTQYTGASVSHLHAHIIQSDPSDPDYTKKKEWSGLVARVG
ncbi:MAG: HIT domain-containing protein [Patescibacteria group bacterium]